MPSHPANILKLHKKSPEPDKDSGLKKNSGGVLLSHLVAQAVPSALKSLTSVFGMGTGVASLPSPPKTVMQFV